MKSEEAIRFTCNICAASCELPGSKFARETGVCSSCGSNVRYRSLIHLLSMELFGESLAIQNFPATDSKVIGLSDYETYSGRLAETLPGYENTYLHKPPVLDISNLDPSFDQSCDCLIASEVLEHVNPPVSRSFENCFRILKPGGAMICSVPYSLDDETVEHFPDLHHFELFEQNGQQVLKNETRDGKIQLFNNLIFHGGGGHTLEMRLFSRASLLRNLKDAGFKRISILNESYPKFGIIKTEEFSLPLIAHKD